MNAIEDRLRDAYRAAADTIPPEAATRLASVVPASRADRQHRPGRPSLGARILIPAAAATAVLAIVAGLVTVAGRHSAAPVVRRQSGTAVGHEVSLGPITPSPSPGHYFLALENNGQGSVYDPLAVYSALTGHLIAALSTPRSPVQPDAAAALGDGSTFIVASTTVTGNRAWCSGTSRLYRLRLAADGRPASLDPLALPAIHGAVESLSATPDGSTVAYTALVCDLPLYGTSVLGVVDTATGQLRQWTWVKPGVLVDSLSLSADGRVLTYLWQRNKVVNSTEGRTLPPWTISQLPVTAAPGRAKAVSTNLTGGPGTFATPAAYRQQAGNVTQDTPGAAVATTDGETVYYCQQVPDHQPGSTSLADYGLIAVRAFDTATRATATLGTVSGFGGCMLAMSAEELLLIVQNDANVPVSSIYRLDPQSPAAAPVRIPDPGNIFDLAAW